MYHSIIIGGKNTYSDWHLVPESRPTIAMPSLNTDAITDVPGVSGSIDLMSYLVPYPIYNNRTGQWKFHVLNDHESWQSLHHKIANHLHKRSISVKLEDDPSYVYTGRVFLDEWVSNNDGTWSDVVLGYDLEPYKKLTTGYSNSFTVGSGSASTTNTINLGSSDIGMMPVCPKVVISNIGTSGVRLTATNTETKMSSYVLNFTRNGTYKLYDVVLTNLSGTNSPSLVFYGQGSVTLSFDKGYL